jgi:DNA-binding transcriptional ArsR family regulator
LINESSVQTAIAMALTVCGALTISELQAALELERSHITKRLIAMRRKNIVVSYKWGGNGHIAGAKIPPNWKILALMWALDIRHPLYFRIRHAMRNLTHSFPLPGKEALRWPRHYNGPRVPIENVTRDKMLIFGEEPQARLIMFLSHANDVPIETISKLLGLSRGTMGTVDVLTRWGIIKSRYVRNERRISLDRTFCAYRSLRELACAIDKATGGEYAALAWSRVILLDRKRLAIINAKRAARRAAGKPYFKSPTGFAVTGRPQDPNFSKKRDRSVDGPTPNLSDGGQTVE